MRARTIRSLLAALLLAGLSSGCPHRGTPRAILRLPVAARRLVCTSPAGSAAAPGLRQLISVTSRGSGPPRVSWIYGNALPALRTTPRPPRMVRRGVAARGELARSHIRLAFAGGRVTARTDPTHRGLLAGELTVTDGSSPSGPVRCWYEPRPRPYRYDPARGGCYDAGGRRGLRRLPLEVIRETKDGECVDFRASGITQLPQGWRAARGWNLKGSDLGPLRVYTSGLLDARLQGAQLDDMTLFYFCLTGQVDRHTRQHRRCRATGSMLRCGDSCP